MAPPNERPTNGESTRQNIEHMALHQLMKRAFGSSPAFRSLLSKRQLFTLFRTAKRAEPRYRDLLFIGTERDIAQAFGTYQLVVKALLSAMGRSLTVRSVSTDPGAVHARRAPEAPLLRDMSELRDEVARRSATDITLVMLGQSFGPYLSSTQKVMMPFQAAGIPVAFCFPYIPLGSTPPGDIFADAVHLIYSDPSDDKGDFLEFGVYFGRTLLAAAHTFGGPFPGMRFFGFDTYEGIKGSMDQEQHLFAESGYYANLASFKHSVAYSGVDGNRVVAVPGDVTLLTSETLEKLGIRKCLCAHIDVDVYRAAKRALDVITPIIEQGTLLLFDDYYTLKSDNRLGERRAIKEWLEQNPRISLEVYRNYGPTQIAYVVHQE